MTEPGALGPEEIARLLLEHGLVVEDGSFAPSGGGGASFTGVQAGTYLIGGGSITINGKGQVLAITPAPPGP